MNIGFSPVIFWLVMVLKDKIARRESMGAQKYKINREKWKKQWLELHMVRSSLIWHKIQNRPEITVWKFFRPDQTSENIGPDRTRPLYNGLI